MIGVGIIGANPDRSWAIHAHVPALNALPQYRIAAVATTKTETAERAAALAGAEHAITDARRLVEHPDVDLVVVAVKVPAHAELIELALAAGKHVLCEWPLALTTAEAQRLAAAAEHAGVVATVGLQARFAPAVQAARTAIAEGKLGTVTSVTLHAARSKGSTVEVPEWTAYTYDGDSGAGLLEVYGGHTLDAVQYLVGELTDVVAMLAVQRPHHVTAETGAAITVTSPDDLVASARTKDGAQVSIHLHDGIVGESHGSIEITGTEGTVVLDGGRSADPLGVQLQITPLRISGGLQLSQAYQGVPAVAQNVAGLYAQLAVDIETGSRNAPTFVDGVHVHELLDRIRAAAGQPFVRA